MNLPDDVEIIFLDDGSDPPLEDTVGLKNLIIHPTNDTRPWTVGLARNMGARMAKGQYYLMTDIDYIIPWEAIDHVRSFDGDKVRFKRRFGVLTEDGLLSTDLNLLAEYGLLEERRKTKGNYLPPHPNNFAMRKDIFWDLGGYDENKMHLEYPKCTDDGGFKRRWVEMQNKGLVKDSDHRPTLYMFPSGQFCSKTDVDYNPFNLFHTHTRKTKANIYWERGRRGK
jgi:hypothetical protein